MKKFLLALVFLFIAALGANAQDTTAVCPTIEEIENSTLLNVFPNPTNGTFQIVYASNTECPPPGWGGKLIVNVINSNGITVYSETVPDFDGEYNKIIDLSTLERGDYVIEIVTGRQKRIKREMLR
jgi:hypothetical protein